MGGELSLDDFFADLEASSSPSFKCVASAARVCVACLRACMPRFRPAECVSRRVEDGGALSCVLCVCVCVCVCVRSTTLTHTACAGEARKANQ